MNTTERSVLDHCQQYKRWQRTFHGFYFRSIGLPSWSFSSSGPSKPHLWLQKCVEMQNVAWPHKSQKTKVTDWKILFTGRRNCKLRRKTYLSIRKSDPNFLWFRRQDQDCECVSFPELKTSIMSEQITKHLCSNIAAFAVAADADLAYLR